MPLVGFEPTISEDERPQTYALDRATTETSIKLKLIELFQNAEYFAHAFGLVVCFLHSRKHILRTRRSPYLLNDL